MEAKNADLAALRINRLSESASVINFQSFSEIGFGFALSPGVIVSALIFAVVMGVVGGFLPAARAARLDIVNALRAS
jgi:putative ABC transport system permease protein